MSMISVSARCVICERDMARVIRDKERYSAELSELLFCDECRKRLKEILYKEEKE